jgi:hypothetical protein
MAASDRSVSREAEMTFETMDWEAESVKIQQAFYANDLVPFHEWALEYDSRK